MIPPLPADIVKISAPLLTFCGDPSLCVYIADRFFRDGAAHYSIEFLEEGDLNEQRRREKPSEDKRMFIMKSDWYDKHSHRQPALCLFCVSVDLQLLTTDSQKWKIAVSDNYKRIKSYYGNRVPSFISIFVCPRGRDALNTSSIKEDQLIREYILMNIMRNRLNSVDLDNNHSCLFFEDELIASALGAIKSLKSEVYQVCHNYYSTRLDTLDSDMCSSPSEVPPRK